MTLTTLTRTLTGIALALVATAAIGCATTQQGQSAENTAAFSPSEQVQSATAVLRSYEAALNRADVEAIVSLYASDAVFMAQHRTPAIGRDEIEKAYRDIFHMIRLDIKFEIDEVVVASPTIAYARTRSSGTTTILANDVKVSEGNQELFVLVRNDDGGNWQIGRYIFSTTQPPRN